MLALLLGLCSIGYGLYIIATARRTSADKGNVRFLGYPSYSVANLRLVGAGFCLIGIFGLVAGRGFIG